MVEAAAAGDATREPWQFFEKRKMESERQKTEEQVTETGCEGDGLRNWGRELLKSGQDPSTGTGEAEDKKGNGESFILGLQSRTTLLGFLM